MSTTEQQYLDLCERVKLYGTWVENKRTGTRCLTVINADLNINLRHNQFPVITTRKMNWKMAIAEFLGYLKGYHNAADFRALGAKTWDANANDNQAWLNNPYRQGEDDMGFVYGAVAHNWPKYDKTSVNLFEQVYNDLKQGIDNRGEIITFWNPGQFELGCLRPCMHSHQFSILGDKLYLNSQSRSMDILLGGSANIIQAAFFLQLMAQITGLTAAEANIKIVNAHIYDNQLDVYIENKQWQREQYKPPQLVISDDIKTWDDVVNKMTVEDVKLENYQHHDPIKYPFTV